MSYAEFLSAMGDKQTADRVEKFAPRIGDNFIIPDWTVLEPGDVILSSAPLKYRSTPVYVGQRAQGFSEDTAKWGHAMLYTGKLHVAESQTFFKTDGSLWPQSGTRLWPLTAYLPTNELLVCRLPDGLAPQTVRKKIADQALHDLAAANRGYNFQRLLVESWLYQLMAKILPSRFWRKGITTEAAIICSEYVLECIATGAGILVEEFDRVNSKVEIFCPASFAASTKFRTFPAAYREVTPPQRLKGR